MSGRYTIATVAQLTGVPTETLRTWERRYGVVTPERSAGRQRRYTADDIERLRLIAALVERGERIGTIATLPRPELTARLSALAGARGGGALPVSNRPIRVLVRHTGAAYQATRRIGGVAPSRTALEVVDTADAFDLLVVGPAPLRRDALDRLRAEHGQPPTVVLYTFLPESTRAELAAPTVRLLSTPRPVSELRQAIVDFYLSLGLPRLAPGPGVPPPRYTEGQLAELAELRSDLACACPNHAASLVRALLAFEAYSLRCVDDSPEDAAVHQALAEGTARARVEMEGLLTAVCEHDGLDVPGPARQAGEG